LSKNLGTLTSWNPLVYPRPVTGLLYIIFSTYFEHFYAHHQELETILMLLPHMVCDALVAGGRRSGAVQQLCVRDEGSITAALLLTSDYQQPRHYTPCAAAITQV
jgi:hypothetical protein